MECPGCHQSTISAPSRIRIALRDQVRCPVCGVQVRLTGWPRRLHTLTGDLSLVAGLALAFLWMAPWPVAVAIGWWTTLALVLPLSPDPNHER